MTNAEKYLKDGVEEEEFVMNLHYFWWANEYDVCEGIRKFLRAEAKKEKPTLTEDERVILRNIRNKKAIGRDKDKGLYFGSKVDGRFFLNSTFGHLFQFIKERRRIFY